MLVALTGATGFLGRRTLAALRGHGHAARALSRRKEQPAELEGLVKEWCFGDQYDPAVQARLVTNVGAVMHVAMDWKALNDEPRANLERNLAGTLQLLEAAREARVPQFVFVSSLDVYGNAAGQRRLTEMDLPLPNSIYGAFKAAIEMHLHAYQTAFGMNTSSWRPAAMYGIKPGIESSLWHDVLRRVRRGETVTEPTAADVVSVDDVSDALALAIGDETAAGQIFNLVDVRLDWPTVAEMARRMIRKTDGSTHAGLSNLESRFDSRKAMGFFDRHGRHEALRRGLAGAASYLAGLLSADSTL